MGRYTGPKTKVSRRYGVPIFGSSKALERKNYPPGMHGPRGSRRKQSEYAIAIKDKPKSRQLVLRNLDLTQIVPVPDWLTVDRDALSGKVARIPSREEMQPIVNEQLIVELYSR